MSSIIRLSVVPEIRQLIGRDYRAQLGTKYSGYLLPSNQPVPSDASQSPATIFLYFDWESPSGDVAGTITTSKTECHFRGTVSTDHLKLTCHNPDLSFDGHIYSDGHIKGTLSSGSNLTLWYLNRVSKDIPISTPAPTSSAVGGITGTWRGEWAVDSFGRSYEDTLSLTQTDDSIRGKGNAHYTSSPTVTLSETISGSISGNSVRLTEHVNELYCSRTYTLTLSQDGQSLIGSYVGCGTYTVTVQFAKQ